MILFLGLGRMGPPMAMHLLSAGMHVVGYDLGPNMEIALATAKTAGVALPLSEKVSELVQTIEVLSHA
jgi:3-hydroxyisobutyrate dehydrogenase-like beta-hydroxyacid dehydrogenase